ncbi:hypothetical protein PAECIP111890_01030 [Paenibacillus sp. JJ-223]|nr:hypothetical protein PAECIP111890_01030 [Paenibacillus sp. JJ-223]
MLLSSRRCLLMTARTGAVSYRFFSSSVSGLILGTISLRLFSFKATKVRKAVAAIFFSPVFRSSRITYTNIFIELRPVQVANRSQHYRVRRSIGNRMSTAEAAECLGLPELVYPVFAMCVSGPLFVESVAELAWRFPCPAFILPAEMSDIFIAQSRGNFLDGRLGIHEQQLGLFEHQHRHVLSWR